MKISLFNRPCFGLKQGMDPAALAAGVITVGVVVLFCPWHLLG